MIEYSDTIYKYIVYILYTSYHVCLFTYSHMSLYVCVLRYGCTYIYVEV